jgi:hypothetical protein
LTSLNCKKLKYKFQRKYREMYWRICITKYVGTSVYRKREVNGEKREKEKTRDPLPHCLSNC